LIHWKGELAVILGGHIHFLAGPLLFCYICQKRKRGDRVKVKATSGIKDMQVTDIVQSILEEENRHPMQCIKQVGQSAANSSS
jgi:hypothetical protein